MDENQIRKSRLKRSALALERRHAELRAVHGEAVIGKLNALLGMHAPFDPSHVDDVPKCSPIIAKRIEQSDGLVAAYIGLSRAREILTCCQASVGGDVSARIWFDEKCYLGSFRCENLQLPALADLAKAIEDRVQVLPDAVTGLIVVDYYDQSRIRKDTDFTILVQGSSLENRVRDCFA
jgi:hypothetical protein